MHMPGTQRTWVPVNGQTITDTAAKLLHSVGINVWKLSIFLTGNFFRCSFTKTKSMVVEFVFGENSVFFAV